MTFKNRLHGAIRAFRGIPNLYPTSGGVWQAGLSGTNSGELLKAYRGWVFACASIIAKNVAKVPMRLSVKRGDGNEEITDHPMLDLFVGVNPIQTRFELWWLSMVWLELCGKSFWYLVRNGLGVPQELWPIPPDRMKVVPERERVIGGYLYQHQGKKIAFDAEEIIYLRYPNPTSIYEGMGTLQAATYEYDTDLYMKKHRIATFKNRARPDVVLETDQYLSDPDYTRIRKSWNKIYGDVDNAGKVGILEAGLKVRPFSQTMQELDFVDGARLSRNDILGIFGVPASMLGLVEDVNRANADANYRTFQSEVILPRLIMIAEKLTQDLCPMFDAKLSVAFENPVPEDAERKREDRTANLQIGYTSINEERAKEGMEPAPWGKVPLLPINLYPVNGDGRTENGERKTRTAERAEDEEWRTAVWRDFIARQMPHEKRFQERVKELFEAQCEVVKGKIEEKFRGQGSGGRGQETQNQEQETRGQRPEKAEAQRPEVRGQKKQRSRGQRAEVDYLLFSLDEAQKEWAEALEPEVRTAVEAGVARGAAELGISPFDIGPYPTISEYIRTKTLTFSFEVNETTLNRLRTELSEGIEAGETMRELTERVDGVFGFAEKVRAERIARTETVGASNYGTVRAYQESGIPLEKEWLTARDGKERDSHQMMDGQRQELSDPFYSGEGNALQYPGDGGAPVYEIVNCRCTVISVKKKEK
jgi:HK97 family phage portal protein